MPKTYDEHPTSTLSPCSQGCQFSDFSLISDFLRIRETGIKLILLNVYILHSCLMCMMNLLLLIRMNILRTC